MIQRISRNTNYLKEHWEKLNFYLRVAFILYFSMIFFSSFKLIEQSLLGALGDRIVHFVTYFVISLFVYKGIKFPLLQRSVYAFFIVCGLALIDELGQIFVPHRDPSLDDWISDVAGGVIAIGLFFVAQVVRDGYRWYYSSEQED